MLLRKRIDPLGCLAETVKGYAGHEEALFSKVTALRAALRQGEESAPENTGEREKRGLFHTLFAFAENYPQLKADRSFMDLQNAICETKDRIEVARRDSNPLVRTYNIRRQAFPSNLVPNYFALKWLYFSKLKKVMPSIAIPLS